MSNKRTVKQHIDNFKTKHPEGFTSTEIARLLAIITPHYPKMNMVLFWNALTGVTGMIKDDDSLVYHRDIENALRCAIENRGLTTTEWD